MMNRKLAVAACAGVLLAGCSSSEIPLTGDRAEVAVAPDAPSATRFAAAVMTNGDFALVISSRMLFLSDNKGLLRSLLGDFSEIRAAHVSSGRGIRVICLNSHNNSFLNFTFLIALFCAYLTLSSDLQARD